MDESHAKQKSVTEGHILRDTVYKRWPQQANPLRQKLSGWQELGKERGGERMPLATVSF